MDPSTLLVGDDRMPARLTEIASRASTRQNVCILQDSDLVSNQMRPVLAPWLHAVLKTVERLQDRARSGTLDVQEDIPSSSKAAASGMPSSSSARGRKRRQRKKAARQSNASMDAATNSSVGISGEGPPADYGRTLATTSAIPRSMTFSSKEEGGLVVIDGKYPVKSSEENFCRIARESPVWAI